MKVVSVLLVTICAALCGIAQAKIISSSESHYVLQHEATSVLPPEKLWLRLIEPSEWWDPDHTYSGDSKNLILDAQAGGIWRESWDGNSVVHGTVLNVKTNELLRLDAPFGPLQALAVNTVWTITIEAHVDGSIVTFDEVANGGAESGLSELAKAVDFVKGEALSRLVDTNAK